MDMDDEMRFSITTHPEDFFDDLRKQTAMTRLAEGILCYTDPSFASAASADEPEVNDVIPAAD